MHSSIVQLWIEDEAEKAPLTVFVLIRDGNIMSSPEDTSYTAPEPGMYA